MTRRGSTSDGTGSRRTPPSDITEHDTDATARPHGDADAAAPRTSDPGPERPLDARWATGVRRARILLLLIVLALCGTAVKLFGVQVVDGAELAAEGEALRTQESTINAKRGAILDADGTVLADSVQTYHIACNQVNLRSWKHWVKETHEDGSTETVLAGRGPAEAARLLAPLLGMDVSELGGLMTGSSTYVYLKKNVDAVTYRKIRELDIYGIEWESVFERVHPNGATAGPILGTVNAEGVGSSGLESVFDTLLEGTPGKEALEIDPTGAVIPGGKRTSVEPVEGATLRTTLHADLQYAVQELLDARVAQHQAQWGAVVITEVSTGRILVMADSNSTEPDNADPQPVAAVQYAFEPGSVGKVVTMATALEKGTITPTTPFTVPYQLDLADAGGPITDFHEHATETLTATGILAESSNTGTVLVGETVSSQDRYDVMRAFGLGEATGVELAGESSGLVRDPSEWVGRDRYVSMFGQAYMMTALQEATLMATIGNGGVRMPPRLVDSWQLADGTVHTPDPVQPVQAISSETASELLRMMESVVSTDVGTGQTAAVDGYRLAMKTGTADIVVDGTAGVVSTTAGVIPADQPRLAMSVVLYNPKVGVLSSDSSAPLFGEVTKRAVQSLAIPASSEEADLFPLTPGG